MGRTRRRSRSAAASTSGTEGDDFTGGRVPSHVVAVDHCRRVGADPSPQPDRIDVVFDDVVGGVARLQLDRHRSSRGIAGGQVEEGDHRSPDRFGALAFDEGDADGEFGLADGEAFLVDQTPVVLPHQPELGHLRWGDAGQERVDGGSEVVGAFGGADQGMEETPLPEARSHVDLFTVVSGYSVHPPPRHAAVARFQGLDVGLGDVDGARPRGDGAVGGEGSAGGGPPAPHACGSRPHAAATLGVFFEQVGEERLRVGWRDDLFDLPGRCHEVHERLAVLRRRPQDRRLGVGRAGPAGLQADVFGSLVGVDREGDAGGNRRPELFGVEPEPPSFEVDLGRVGHREAATDVVEHAGDQVGLQTAQHAQVPLEELFGGRVAVDPGVDQQIAEDPPPLQLGRRLAGPGASCRGGTRRRQLGDGDFPQVGDRPVGHGRNVASGRDTFVSIRTILGSGLR